MTLPHKELILDNQTKDGESLIELCQYQIGEHYLEKELALREKIFETEDAVRNRYCELIKLPGGEIMIRAGHRFDKQTVYVPSSETLKLVRQREALKRKVEVEKTLISGLVRKFWENLPYDPRMLDVLTIENTPSMRQFPWRREDCLLKADLFEEACTAFRADNAEALERWQIALTKRAILGAV